MTDRGKVTIVVCAFVAVVGLGLAQGDFYDEGGSAWDIAGWVLFMLAVLVAVAAALLGDRSNLSPGRRFPRLQRPGWVSVTLSGAFAFVALLGFSHQARDPLTCSSTRVLASGIRVAADQGTVGGFPPGRVCREYAQLTSTNGSTRDAVLSEKKVPSDSNYVVGLTIIVSPLLFSMVWRALRREQGLAAESA